MDETDDSHVFTQEYWDERYATHDHVWSGRPNQRLVEQAADLAPGQALDVGCGEGADAVWLAERGWRTTGADVSVVALERARRHAGRGGRRRPHHLGARRPRRRGRLPGGNDLVSAMFIHVPDATSTGSTPRSRPRYDRAGRCWWRATTRPSRRPDLRNPQLSHLLFPPERVTAVLGDGWRVEVAEAVTREAEMHGEPRLATDTVVVARRDLT